MSNIFDSQEQFGGNYTRISEQKLTAEQIENINEIKIVERIDKNGDTFKTMCFLMKNGGQKSFYLNNRNTLEVGDVIDPETVVLYELKDNNTGEVLKPRAEGEAYVF